MGNGSRRLPKRAKMKQTMDGKSVKKASTIIILGVLGSWGALGEGPRAIRVLRCQKVTKR